MWEVLRRNSDTWNMQLSSSFSIAVASDAGFFSFPIVAGFNATETNRNTPIAMPCTLRSVAFNARANALGMDVSFTLRVNGADTTKILTITGGVNAIYSEITTAIKLNQLDLQTWRADFVDPVEPGTVNCRASSLGGSR